MSLPNNTFDHDIVIELPSNASSDQSGVKSGYYRTIAGRERKIQVFSKMGRKSVRLPDPNNFAPLPGGARGIPFGDQIILKCDTFADEAKCPKCYGSGHLDEQCPSCRGNGKQWFDAAGNMDMRASADRESLTAKDCLACVCSSYESPLTRSSGCLPCDACRASGQRSMGLTGIAHTTDSKDEPTTGVVFATGPECRVVTRGMRVMFDRFAGTEYEVDGRKWRIMKEIYPIMEIRGNADIHAKPAAWTNASH